MLSLSKHCPSLPKDKGSPCDKLRVNGVGDALVASAYSRSSPGFSVSARSNSFGLRRSNTVAI